MLFREVCAAPPLPPESPMRGRAGKRAGKAHPNRTGLQTGPTATALTPSTKAHPHFVYFPWPKAGSTSIGGWELGVQ